MAFYDCKRLSHTILVRDHMELDLQELIWLDVYCAASVSVDQRDFLGFLSTLRSVYRTFCS